MIDHTAIGDGARRSKIAQALDNWEARLARAFGRGTQERVRENLKGLAQWFDRAPLASAVIGGLVVALLLIIG